MFFFWLIVHCSGSISQKKSYRIFYEKLISPDSWGLCQPAESQLQGNWSSADLHQRLHPGSAQHQDGRSAVHSRLLHQHEMVRNGVVTPFNLPQWLLMIKKPLERRSLTPGTIVVCCSKIWMRTRYWMVSTPGSSSLFGPRNCNSSTLSDHSRPSWTTWTSAPSCTRNSRHMMTSQRVWNVGNIIFQLEY